MNAATRRSRYTVGLAVVLGLGIGWLDLHTTEVSVTILALLSTGLLQPIAAWRWAVLLGSGLPVVATVGHLLGMRTAEPIRLDPRIVLVGFAFGLVGCYAGVVIRRAARVTLS
jgi:hypothetical protein